MIYQYKTEEQKKIKDLEQRKKLANLYVHFQLSMLSNTSVRFKYFHHTNKLDYNFHSSIKRIVFPWKRKSSSILVHHTDIERETEEKYVYRDISRQERERRKKREKKYF